MINNPQSNETNTHQGCDKRPCSIVSQFTEWLYGATTSTQLQRCSLHRHYMYRIWARKSIYAYAPGRKSCLQPIHLVRKNIPIIIYLVSTQPYTTLLCTVETCQLEIVIVFISIGECLCISQQSIIAITFRHLSTRLE